MIKGSNNVGFTLQCDNCGYEVKNLDNFDEAVNYKRENGWKSKKIDKDEWEDRCPNCI